MNTPILETENLVLRPLAVSDAEHFFFLLGLRSCCDQIHDCREYVLHL